MDIQPVGWISLASPVALLAYVCARGERKENHVVHIVCAKMSKSERNLSLEAFLVFKIY